MAESSEVKLLGIWASPFVLRPRIALNMKNVKYDFIEENMQSKSELLLKSNPVYKKVPVLVHGDKAISESLNIVEYIDEAWSSGPSILPSDPYDRALERFWVAFINDKWSATIKRIDIADGEEAKKEAVDRVVDVLVLLEEAFKKCSKGKAFYGGDRIGYVDIAFGCYLGWLRVREKHHDVILLDPAKTPELVKWAERFFKDPAVVGVMPELEKLGEFAKGVFAKMRAAANLPPK